MKSALHFAGRSPGRIRHWRPSTRTRFPVGLGIALILLSGLACAGGPLKVAGITGFNAGTAGVPLAWSEGLVRYYTDQGDLSPLLLQNDANSFVADAFTRWTNVSTAALSATRAGQLDEDISGLNVSVDADFQITLPLDIQPSALDKPIAIVFDADGQVTDALLGAGAGGSDLCSTNSVYGGPDNYSLDAHLAHALIVINGNCAQTAGDLPILKYKLVRVLGRVLGLDWSDLNENVFNGSPLPTPDDFAGFPLMHALEPGCAPQCLAPADQPKMDDRAAISRLYPVTSSNLAAFPGKQILSENTARIHGAIFFSSATGLPDQGMQGVNVVARWIDPSNGAVSHRYTAASVSGFLFSGNAGNPVTGFFDPAGERFDRFGSHDPATEGSFDLAGLEIPAGSSTAQYQISVEVVDPLCTDLNAVGPYRNGQVNPSGNAPTVVLTVSKGAAITQDFLMSSSAASPEASGTFDVPRNIPGGEWRASLSSYGDTDYYGFSANAKRSMSISVTALDEASQATQRKAQPVIGVWSSVDAAGSLPQVSENFFNTSLTGTTSLNVEFLSAGNFKIGFADVRGDGRPDFRYRAHVLYAHSVLPDRANAQGGTPLTIRGIGFVPGTTATIGTATASIISLAPNVMVISAPSLPDGVKTIILQDPSGATSTMEDALTYGAVPGDSIVLLQGGNPATPVGSEAVNPVRVSVVGVDGVTPVAGASVNFTANPIGLIFSACQSIACTVFTDEQGEASTRLLVTQAGSATITAALISGASVNATVFGTSSALDIALVEPQRWVAQGASGTLLLTARLLSNGMALSGRTVTYQVVQGIATLSAAAALTGSNGSATVNLSVANLSSEIHVSACAAPSGAPCGNFSIFAVPLPALNLLIVAGEHQVIDTNGSFGPVTLLVTDSSSPPNPVEMAATLLRSAISRWVPEPSVNPSVLDIFNFPRPPAPIVLESSEVTINSDAEGRISILAAPQASYGAVVVGYLATVGLSGFQQFELQRLWPAPSGVPVPPFSPRLRRGPASSRRTSRFTSSTFSSSTSSSYTFSTFSSSTFSTRHPPNR